MGIFENQFPRLRHVGAPLIIIALAIGGCGSSEQHTSNEAVGDNGVANELTSSLNVEIVHVDPSTGTVRLNGGDSRQPLNPFTINWGDEQATQGFFPLTHQYQDSSRHYVITVTAQYDSGQSDSKEVTVQFVPMEKSLQSGSPQTPSEQASSVPELRRLTTQQTFRYQGLRSPAAPSLTISIVRADSETGMVELNGSDSRQPTTPFMIEWGDGDSTHGGFPQTHRYANLDQNYVINVTAYYSPETSDTTRTFLRFVPAKLTPKRLSPRTQVTIPVVMPTLGTRLHTPPPLTTFDATSFGATPRSTVEYVLSVAAQVQFELVNQNVLLVDGQFRQFVLRDPGQGGAFSLWYTDPIALATGDGTFDETIPYSSLFHEMGHNFTLNTPSRYIFGGKTDGNANAIYSESIAQIVAHVTAAELVNRYAEFGLPEDIAWEIAIDAERTMDVIQSAYHTYRDLEMPFASWNQPDTPDDETYLTFMTIAYKFFQLADRNQTGYSVPLQRMLALLQTFDADAHERFSPKRDTQDAAAFRSTLMVTALSFAFDQDLRPEFSSLNFPIDDREYQRLMAKRRMLERDSE